jgi:RES domain-containing protein
MLVYRVGKTKYANDLSGEGARLYGGRWNHKLTPCIYTSQSRALALLEYSANVNIEDLGFSLSITTIEIPNKSIKKIQLSALPKDWNKLPAPSSTKEIGWSQTQRPGRDSLDGSEGITATILHGQDKE